MGLPPIRYKRTRYYSQKASVGSQELAELVRAQAVQAEAIKQLLERGGQPQDKYEKVSLPDAPAWNGEESGFESYEVGYLQ